MKDETKRTKSDKKKLSKRLKIRLTGKEEGRGPKMNRDKKKK